MSVSTEVANQITRITSDRNTIRESSSTLDLLGPPRLLTIAPMPLTALLIAAHRLLP